MEIHIESISFHCLQNVVQKLLMCWQKSLFRPGITNWIFFFSLSLCFMLVWFHWYQNIMCNGMENQAVLNCLPFCLPLLQHFLNGMLCTLVDYFFQWPRVYKMVQGSAPFARFFILEDFTCMLPNQWDKSEPIRVDMKNEF